ncbi:MAG: hypothetical protein GX103_05830 [Bacteroidales bacterium]|nr:hypothetical protein [Bacteroidales bacterium]
MKNNTFILGLAPTRRDTRDFELHFARERKAAAEKRTRKIAGEIGNVDVVNIDFINEEGLLIFPEDAELVAKHFIEKGVDAVFIPHVNFGSEEAVALLGKLVGKPVLLWGPRDEAPPSTGPRQTDTQCGLFASGMVLDRYNVPFTYLENCWLDSPLLDEGLERFIRTANVVKTFNSLRIGQISVRPRTFLTVKVNENDLLERFGINIVTIDTTEIMAEINRVLEKKSELMQEIYNGLCNDYDLSEMKTETVENIAAMEAAIIGLSEKYGINAFASECWRTFSVPFGIMPCSGFADLIQRNLPVACEGDIHGAISSALLSAATMGQKPHFLADLTIRHPKNDNAELLWHCGSCPANLAKKGVKPKMKQCLGQFEIEGGDITVCRFGESHGVYKLFSGEGRAVDGPATNGNYLWFETNDWPKWEARLVKGPYIHHISIIHGKYASILRDACEYLKIEADYIE